MDTILKEYIYRGGNKNRSLKWRFFAPKSLILASLFQLLQLFKVVTIVPLFQLLQLFLLFQLFLNGGLYAKSYSLRYRAMDKNNSYG